MKVVYLLNGTALCGGVKVVYQHVAILRGLGVDAEVVSTTPPSDWAPESWAFYRQVRALTPEAIGPADVAVGTMYHTVPQAMEVPGARPFHFCQAYEAIYEPARELWPEIEEVYRLPATKLVVSPHLVDLVRTLYGQEAVHIPQPFDAEAFSPRIGGRPEDGTFRVLLTGQWGVPFKGIPWATEALRGLKVELPRLRLVRMSQDAPPEEVAVWPEAERHIWVPPVFVPDVYRNVDLFLGPSTEVEGFGLPTIEAMSCGLPSVLTDIGAFRGIDPDARASIRIPVFDTGALQAAVRRLADDPGLRARLGSEGRRIARTYNARRTGEALLAAFGAPVGIEGAGLRRTARRAVRAVVSLGRRGDG